MNTAFPDAEVVTELAEPAILEPVNAKDRHVVVTAIATQADAIVTFNRTDFAATHLKEHLQIEVIHPETSSWIWSISTRSAQLLPFAKCVRARKIHREK
jgi:hypothetical protein